MTLRSITTTTSTFNHLNPGISFTFITCFQLEQSSIILKSIYIWKEYTKKINEKWKCWENKKQRSDYKLSSSGSLRFISHRESSAGSRMNIVSGWQFSKDLEFRRFEELLSEFSSISPEYCSLSSSEAASTLPSATMNKPGLSDLVEFVCFGSCKRFFINARVNKIRPSGAASFCDWKKKM